MSAAVPEASAVTKRPGELIGWVSRDGRLSYDPHHRGSRPTKAAICWSCLARASESYRGGSVSPPEAPFCSLRPWRRCMCSPSVGPAAYFARS